MKAGRQDNDLMQKVLAQATSVVGVNMEALVGKPAEVQDEPKKRRKYHNVKVEHDGRKFDSMRERDRYIHLKALESGKIISNLQCQVKYRIEVNGQKIATWTADFVYVLDSDVVVEDVKAVRTQMYNLKKRLMKACHGIEIIEV
jgi:hypothetical protein